MSIHTCTAAIFALVLIMQASGIQYMGRALSFDWHFRSQRLPPYRNTLDLDETPSSRKPNRTYKFVAFGKRWMLDLTLNTMLISPRTTFTERTVNGGITHKFSIPKDCIYIGTAKADDSEFGMASLTTCNGKIRGLIVTNVNDYVIYEKDWKNKRQKRTADVKNPSLALKLADTTKYQEHIQDILSKNVSSHRVKREADGVIETPLLHRLDAPPGRRLFLELGIVLDKNYMNDFNEQVSEKRDDLILHIIETYNNAQLWYLHPTFGFQMWLIVKDVIFVNDDIPITLTKKTPSHPAAICNWVNKSFKDNNLWDEVIIMSSKEGIWHGRVGIAQRAGVCSADGTERCAGVTHVNFQKASLARLITHEGMHPLGVGDDYDGRTSHICFSGIMRRGVWQDHDWSVCSVQEFERWAGVRSSVCIAKMKTPSHSFNMRIPLISVNVAWRAGVVQSSTYFSDLEWGAWKATDGPITGVPAGKSAKFGSCTHTLREDKPWIRVQLDLKYSRDVIDTVIIYNRDDCCAERLNNFEVRVGNSLDINRNALCTRHSGTVSGGKNGAAVIQCDKQLTGRYVSVQLLNSSAILTVCEIQVMQKMKLKDFDYRMNTCVDNEGFCSYWASVGECTNRDQKEYMRTNCQYSCGVCKRDDASIPADQMAPVASMLTTSRPSSSCSDTHESCSHFAANGDCWIELDMRTRCPRSCGFCPTQQTPAIPSAQSVTTSAPTTPITTPTAAQTVTPTTTPITVSTHTTKVPENTKNTKTTQPKAAELITALPKPTDTPSRFTTESTGHTRLPLFSVNRQRVTSDPYGGRCVDKSQHCVAWIRQGYCITSSVVKNLCVKSCNACEELVQSIHQVDDEQSTCSDRSSHCSAWRSRGRCALTSVRQNCPKTCGNCGNDVILPPVSSTVTTVTSTTKSLPSPSNRPLVSTYKCVDKKKDCPKWKSVGHCSVAVVEQTCPRSCGKCISASDNVECQDSITTCKHWARNHWCSRRSVKKACQLSCMQC